MTKQDIITIIKAVVTGFVFAFGIVFMFSMYATTFDDIFAELCLYDHGDLRFFASWICIGIATYSNLIKKQNKKK